MNVSGFIRGMMAKRFSVEDYLLKVAESIEYQLNEWEKGYELLVLKLADYEIWVKKDDEYIYELSISEGLAKELQNRSPFSLDRELWSQLEAQGLKIKKGYGNYMDVIGW